MIKNKTKDGKHFWTKTIIKPILDFNGIPIEYIAIRVDITELEVAKQELEKTNFQKNRFVSMVAHDLGNLLHPILLNTEMLTVFCFVFQNSIPRFTVCDSLPQFFEKRVWMVI